LRCRTVQPLGVTGFDLSGVAAPLIEPLDEQDVLKPLDALEFTSFYIGTGVDAVVAGRIIKHLKLEDGKHGGLQPGLSHGSNWIAL
jgi:hypothetical protein